MPNRLLSAVLVLQTLLLATLLAEKLIPTAHASVPVSCNITNWPDVLSGRGFATMRVRVEEVNGLLPVTVKDWETSDEVKVVVQDWNANDVIKAQVVDWNTTDTVRVTQ